MLLFTQYKPTWLTTIGSQCLAALSANVARCLRSTVTCGKTSAAATGAEAEVKILPCLLLNKDQQLNNSLVSLATCLCRQRSRAWVNCKLITAWLQNS